MYDGGFFDTEYHITQLARAKASERLDLLDSLLYGIFFVFVVRASANSDSLIFVNLICSQASVPLVDSERDPPRCPLLRC